jgi:hypothetical protein
VSQEPTGEGEDVEAAYTEWRCTNCGRGVPKHNPPCKRCGNMQFEQFEVRASDVDVGTASTRELLRENARPVGAGLLVLAVVAAVSLANVGVFVISDPLGLGYRYGAVTPVAADDDSQLTAAEFHGQVASEYRDTSLSWSGRTLELSYASDATSNEALAAELVEVAVLYATYVDDGGDAARLQIAAELEGRGQARVVVGRADAAAFAAGDISRATYRERVLAAPEG